MEYQHPGRKTKIPGSTKLFAYGLTVVQAAGYVLSGTFGSGLTPVIMLLLIGQITMGGWIIILLDDLVQKWGFGSGVGLFIHCSRSFQSSIHHDSFTSYTGRRALLACRW